jgi:hypothetical protein
MLSSEVVMNLLPEIRDCVGYEHGANSQRLCFWGIGAENNLLRQFALLDLSILNFSIVLGKSSGPSCNRPAKHHSRSHDAVIRVYDDAGNLIETLEHEGGCVSSSQIIKIPVRAILRDFAFRIP